MDERYIPLSDREYAFLDEQAANAGHATPEDYAAALIRAEMKAKAREELEAMLQDGLASKTTEWTEADSTQLLRLAAKGH